MEVTANRLQKYMHKYLDTCIDDAREILNQNPDRLTKERTIKGLVRAYDMVKNVTNQIERNEDNGGHLAIRRRTINSMGGIII